MSENQMELATGVGTFKMPTIPDRMLDPAAIEKVLLQGDLSGLTPDQRLHYYKVVCDTLGINYLTKPFDYIMLDGKLTLYARKDCTEQLRRIYAINIKIVSRERIEDSWVVTTQAALPSGRVDESIGAVSLAGLKGVAFANALMKAETKSKRRVTLSICGLGMMDESEIEDVRYEYPAPDDGAIERNVRQATANAATAAASGGAGGAAHATMSEPKEVTAENWKEVVSHVGKAEGELLGKKVGELHPNVVEWMYKKWRDTLGPSATEKDMRLKKAIEFACKALKKPPEKPVAVPATIMPATNRAAMLATILGRGEDLVLTRRQLAHYIKESGYADITDVEQLDDHQLAVLLEPGYWQTFKESVEAQLKPKVDAAAKPKPKPRRSRKR